MSVKVFAVDGRESQAHSWCNVHNQEVNANHICGSILVDHARHPPVSDPLCWSAERVSFNDMIPDGSAPHDLPYAVTIVAVAMAHLIKVEYGIKASIMGESKLFDVQEKHLRQVVKGVKYQSGWQWKWQRDHASKMFKDQNSVTLTCESSSSSDDGAKALKKHHKQSKSRWWQTLKQLTLMNFCQIQVKLNSRHCQPSWSSTPTFSLSHILFQILCPCSHLHFSDSHFKI